MNHVSDCGRWTSVDQALFYYLASADQFSISRRGLEQSKGGIASKDRKWLINTTCFICHWFGMPSYAKTLCLSVPLYYQQAALNFQMTEGL